MPILDISGVYCPQGCGQTLHLMSGGMIQCLARGCPEPGSAQKILSDPETGDIVQIDESGWSILHPLRERLQPGGLHECAVNKAIARLALLGRRPADPGQYRVTIVNGTLNFESLHQDLPAQESPDALALSRGCCSGCQPAGPLLPANRSGPGILLLIFRKARSPTGPFAFPRKT